MRPGGFFSELQRRRVWRVAGAYVLVVWMALEIILETSPVLGLPEWLSRAAVLLAIVGFPVTLVLAWVFDLTAHGVVRTRSLEEGGDGTVPRAPVSERARAAGVFGAGIIVALVGFGAYAAIRPAPVVRPESIEAVAVLPFNDLSPTDDQQYFADGVTEELINRLARIGEIQVAGRTSSFAFRDTSLRLREIAGELGVDAIVEGSIRRSGSRLRVTVELVDAQTGFQIWSQTYDRTVDDIFAIQEDISSAIVDALRVQLLPGTSRRRAGTENPRAHDAYLLGLSRWNARTEPDLRRALEFFESAADEDPAYAPAYAGLALTYAILPTYADFPLDVAAERGSEAAARALALDAQNAEAHAAIGRIAQGLEWNLEAAGIAYRRALDFQPSYATGHDWYAETLLVMGRLEEARLEVEEALELDPLSVASQSTRAYLQTVSGDYGRARRSYERLLSDHPGYVLGHAQRVFLCLAADCHDEAELAARAAWEPGAATIVRAVIDADREGGREREVALTGLREAEGLLRPVHRALLHAALDDREAAVALVQRAYDEGEDPSFMLFLVHPLFDPLRRDPRFVEITRALDVEAPLAGTPVR